MIIKGFTVTSGDRHAAHLLRLDENEHVLVHEIRGFEPPRVCRRLHSLRDWSHEQTEDLAEVFAGGA